MTVTDPVVHKDGALGSHVIYRVRSTIHYANGQSSQGFVLRRFREFEWLHNALKRCYIGCIIPPIPEKSAFGRFEPKFIEERRCALENFIRRVAAHSDMRSSPAFTNFLLKDTSALQTIIDENSLPDPFYNVLQAIRLKHLTVPLKASLSLLSQNANANATGANAAADETAEAKGETPDAEAIPNPEGDVPTVPPSPFSTGEAPAPNASAIQLPPTDLNGPIIPTSYYATILSEAQIIRIEGLDNVGRSLDSHSGVTSANGAPNPPTPSPGAVAMVVAASAGSASYVSQAVTLLSTALINMFSHTVETVQGALTQGKHIDQTLEDRILERAASYARRYQEKISKAISVVENLLNQAEEFRATMAQLGKICSELADHERGDLQESLAVSLQHFSECIAKVNELEAQVPLSEQLVLRDHLKDQYRMAGAVLEMLEARAAVLAEYNNTVRNVEQKELKLRQLPNGQPVPSATSGITPVLSSDPKVQAYQQAVLDARLHQAWQREYLKKITEFALAELALWKNSKRVDSINSIRHYAQMRQRLSTMASHLWAELSSVLQLQVLSQQQTQQQQIHKQFLREQQAATAASGSGSEESKSNVPDGQQQ